MLSLSGIALISACLLTSCALGGGHENINIDSSVTSKEIMVNTRDNLNISLKEYAPKAHNKLPAVLLLHMLGKNKESWNNYIPELLNNGYIVYNADLRGHGRSVRMQGGHEIFYQNMNELDWSELPLDVADLVNFISQDKLVDSQKVGIIGASIGGNSGIIAASDYSEKIRTVVALSPGLDYHGLKTLQAAEKLKSPLLIAVSKGDEYSYKSSNQLNEVVKTSHDLLIYNGIEHGTNLLNSSEDLQKKIISWLNEHLK